MRCFYYQRLLPTGELKPGFEKLAFSRRESARYYLEQRQDSVIVRLFMLPRWFNIVYDNVRRIVRSPVTREQLSDFIHNLAVMQRSGIPTFEALEELAADASRPQVRHMALSMLDSLRSGAPLSTAMERHDGDIPQTVVHMARIGESSGTLDRTLMDAAEHLRRVGKIAEDARRAMIYPAFVFMAIIAASMFWIVYVIPGLSDLFRQMGVEMPPITRAVLGFSDSVADNILGVAGVGFALIYGAWLLVRYHRKSRYRFHWLLMKVPVSSILMRSSALAFITEYMSLLAHAGINTVDSLKVIERSTANEVFRDNLRRVRLGMKRGNSLSDEMRKVEVFPGFVVRMVSVGEQTGSLDAQLHYLAEDYRRRFDHVVGSISEIVKPAVMVLAGALFILMIVALFLPIYDLIRQMSAPGF